MFEYNFGDSEFLMLFLVLVTLPYAADRAVPAVMARTAVPRAIARARRRPRRHRRHERARRSDSPPRGRTVLIVGDLMLDHFVIGGVERISPEAPVPVVRFDHEEYRLGGAANVAHNVAALGGRVEIVGLVGHDAEADAAARRSHAASAIGTRGVIADRGPLHDAEAAGGDDRATSRWRGSTTRTTREVGGGGGIAP